MIIRIQLAKYIIIFYFIDMFGATQPSSWKILKNSQ